MRNFSHVIYSSFQEKNGTEALWKVRCVLLFFSLEHLLKCLPTGRMDGANNYTAFQQTLHVHSDVKTDCDQNLKVTNEKIKQVAGIWL